MGKIYVMDRFQKMQRLIDLASSIGEFSSVVISAQPKAETSGVYTIFLSLCITRLSVLYNSQQW